MQHIQDNLCSFQKPAGSVTNSDLELAGNLAQKDILAQEVELMESNVAIGTDNWATVSWRRNFYSTTPRARACLLKLNSFHQQHYHYLHTYFYVSGPANSMFNKCSRCFDLSDPQLLTYFNYTYPKNEWCQMRHLRPIMDSVLISFLYFKIQLLLEIIPGPNLATICGNNLI